MKWKKILKVFQYNNLNRFDHFDHDEKCISLTPLSKTWSEHEVTNIKDTPTFEWTGDQERQRHAYIRNRILIDNHITSTFNMYIIQVWNMFAQKKKKTTQNAIVNYDDTPTAFIDGHLVSTVKLNGWCRKLVQSISCCFTLILRQHILNAQLHPGRLKDVRSSYYMHTILHVKINISNTQAFWEGAEHTKCFERRFPQ